METILKSKRGRKPKQILNEPVIIEKKKRGRKPTCQIFEMKEINDIIKNLPEECIIAHLPICYDDVQNIINNDEIIDTNENITVDNDKNKLNFCLESELNDKLEIECQKCVDLTEKISNLNNKIVELTNNIDNSIISKKNIIENTIHLEDYYNDRVHENDTNKLNEDIVCWWCCHSFENLPVGLPFKYHNDSFYVYGYFCSFNCCLTYNFSLNDYYIWERTSLLYNYKNKIIPLKEIKIIKAAPPRETLKIFGGRLNIKDFRYNTVILNKNYRLIIPNTYSLVSIVEEVDENYKENINFTNNNLLNNLINEDKLLLKRSKPIQKNKVSLLSMMKIET